MKNRYGQALSVTRVCSALLLAILLSLTIYRTALYSSEKLSDDLQITALSQIPEGSWSNEVRINSILLDGKPLDLATVEISDNWKYEEGLLYSYDNANDSTIVIPINDVRDVELNCIGQVGSGFIRISCGAIEKEENLYRDADWDSVQIQIAGGDILCLWKFVVLNILFTCIVLLVGKIWRSACKRQVCESSHRDTFLSAILIWMSSFITDRMAFRYMNKLNDVRMLVKITEFKILYLAVLLVIGYITTYVIQKYKDSQQIGVQLKYFSVYLVIMMIVLLCIWPGNWRWDEFAVLENMVNLDLNTWQHYLTSVYYILGFMAFPFPGGFVFAQVTIIAVAVSYIISNVFVKASEEFQFRYLIPFLLFPIVDNNLFPLRLSIYAYIELVFFVFLKKHFTQRWTLKIYIAVSLQIALIGVWRSEGIVVAMAALAMILVFHKKTLWRGKCVLVMTSILMFTILSFPQSYLSHQRADFKMYRISPFIEFSDDLIKYEVETNGYTADIEAVGKVCNLDVFLSEERGEDAFWHGGIKNDYSEEEYKAYEKALLHLIYKHPTVYLKERYQTFLKTSGLIKNVSNSTPNTIHIYDDTLARDDAVRKHDFFQNDFVLTKPLDNNIRVMLIEKLECLHSEDSTTTPMYGVWYNLFIPVAGLLFVMLICLKKHKIVDAVIAFLYLGQFSLMFLIAPAAYFMYYFPIYLTGYIGLFAIAYKLYDNWKQKNLRIVQK